MCLILFALNHHPDYPLVVTANRDEFYQRPTRGGHFWPEAPSLFAGRDLRAGGTWMGVTVTGRFAAVTNFREGIAAPKQAISRGHLCENFLNSAIDANTYLQQIHQQKNGYAGFNLLLGEPTPTGLQLFYYSNRQPEISKVASGIHGLGNGLLNESWPKVDQGKYALQEKLRGHADMNSLQSILLDRTTAEDDDLPETGIDTHTERLLSSRFIHSDNYGTRTTTVLRIHRDKKIEWLEQGFDNSGASSEKEIFRLN